MPEINNESLEWDYPPPPTPYDQVRDNPLTRLARLAVHCIVHPFIRAYNTLTVINGDAITKNWPCIVTPNHSSHMDTMAVFASLPLGRVNHLFAVAAKDYFFRNSAVALGARLMANVIPVDREGVETMGLKLSLRKLASGNSVVMFPEGTRTTTGNMGTFKSGAIMLSRHAMVPIIPAYINGTLQSMPKSTEFPRPVKISVIYGEPVFYWKPPLETMDAQEATRHLELQVTAIKLKWEKERAG